MRARRLLASVYLALTASIAGATTADDLCAPIDDPCVVTGAVTVEAGSTLDFGARTFRVADGAMVVWSADTTVIAAACDFQPKSKVAESRTSTGAGYLSLDCGAATLAGRLATVGSGVIVEGDGPHVVSGQIQAVGDQVNVIAIDSFGMPGDITVTGKYKVKAKLGTPPGEFRMWTTFGDIVIAETAKLKVQGAHADPFSEFFFLQADSGSLTIDGQIDVKQKLGAYAVSFEADGDVTFGPKSKVKGKAKETGAEVAINSQSGSVVVRGKIQVPMSGTVSDGAKINICAAGDILVKDKALLDSSSGNDGQVILGAGGLARVGELGGVGAKVLSKTDGDIEVCGGTAGEITSRSVVIPEADATGMTGECLSPGSGVIFILDCAQ